MWAVVSSKGGVGKSSIAKNLLLPYLINKYGEAVYINTDPTNDEDKLVNAKHYKVKSLRIKPEKMEEIDISYEVVLDTGAGKNSIEVINALNELGMETNTKIVIPIGKRISEINEALKTYSFAKRKGFSKFVFVLNKVSSWDNYEEEFDMFFNPIRAGKEAPINLIEENDRNIVKFPLDTYAVLGNIEDLEKRLPYDFLKDFEEFNKTYMEKLTTNPKSLTVEEKRKRRFFKRLKNLFELILSKENIATLERVEK